MDLSFRAGLLRSAVDLIDTEEAIIYEIILECLQQRDTALVELALESRSIAEISGLETKYLQSAFMVAATALYAQCVHLDLYQGQMLQYAYYETLPGALVLIKVDLDEEKDESVLPHTHTID